MVKVSIPKAADGAGAPSIKNPTVVLIDVEDLLTFPTRTHGTTVISEDLELKEGAKAVGIYATPSSIEITREASGEADARSLIKGVTYNHPGDSADIENHTEGFLNKGVVALITECDGNGANRVRLVGSLCNPLYMSPEYTNTKEATTNRFVWKQEQGDKYAVATYTGTMPELAASAAAAPAQEGA